MKKVILLGVLATGLFQANTFAYETVSVPVSTLTSTATATSADLITTYKDNTSTGINLDYLTKKYDVILRNNNISADNDYNSKNYYTSKLKSDDLVIPDEIKNNSSRIYFLVEEGTPIMYFKNTLAAAADTQEVSQVKKEYNYKTVDFVGGQSEYIFNNSDLVKDFAKDEYKSVTISLVAELNSGEKMYLTNGAYFTIGNKQRILDNLLNSTDSSNYVYYDTNSLQEYLQKIGEKISRDDYKKLLNNAKTKLNTLDKQNQDLKTSILKSISKESDLTSSLDKYRDFNSNNNLISSLLAATNQELQKLKSYDVIDNIFKK